MSSRPIPSIATAVILAATLTVPLIAQGADAMRVVRDPQTGELRGPNAAEAAAFKKADEQLRAGRASTARSAGPSEITHPDGSVETKLDEDTMMSSVVTLGANGTLQYDCLPAKEAQKLVKSSTKKVATAKAAAKAGHDHN